jgi:hypothetical protein
MIDQRFTHDALDRLRMVGDEPADALARALLTAYGADEHDETEVVGQAIRVVLAGTASEDDAVVAWLSEGPDLPAWAKGELIAAGQRFFRVWPMPIATTLFCAALPTAYAAPHGAAVLMATSHLKQRSYVARRLAKTGQMLFDVMDFAGTSNGGLQPGSQGYLVAREVRLLHAVVRQALLAREEPWPDEHGMPINQEDLLGTLFSFTVSVLDGLTTLGVPVSDDDAEGYLHAWCAIGALLGIDESLLPLAPDQAREVARTIARRQLRPSPAGTTLAGELLREMQKAMPVGCKDLPAALVHRLVPDVADILDVPPVDSPWTTIVHGACSLGRRVPTLIRLAGGPAAMVGRSMLRTLIDREQRLDSSSYRVDAAALRRAVGARTRSRTDRRQPSGEAVGFGSHAGPTSRTARAALAHPIDLPIDAEDVRLVASEGFPLWEPVDVMVHRNRRITAAYADLSARLARVIAGRDGALDANWCTFATWASKTLGTFLEDIPGDEGRGVDRLGRTDTMPGEDGTLTRHLEQVTRRLMTRRDGASFRTLAAGNRAVFLEIGLSIATFVDHFLEGAAGGRDREGLWEAYWTAVEAQLEQFAVLDPSWLLTPHPRPDDLRLGLRQYFDALWVDDREQRSQHVLAGNLLLGAYEQRRADGYVWAALALFTDRAMRRLVCDRSGAVGGVRRWPNDLFARLMTGRMILQLPHELLDVGQPIPPPPNRQDSWHSLTTDVGVTLPILQALITRYQLTVGSRSNRGARNWTSFDQRMRTVGNLFRLRQRQADLFDDPFTPAETAQLLAGGDGVPR